jgi:hypothetical protein
MWVRQLDPPGVRSFASSIMCSPSCDILEGVPQLVPPFGFHTRNHGWSTKCGPLWWTPYVLLTLGKPL